MACPQCGQNQVDEPKLVEHLLSEHQIHMVTPNTTSLTRCPVCRKGVSDLSHHFAMEHEDSTARPVTKIARSTVTRIIPIVLPNQPCKYLLIGFIRNYVHMYVVHLLVAKRVHTQNPGVHL